MSQKNEANMPIVWMDLEMTGLNVDQEAIIEIATIITDKDLNVVASGPELVLHQPAERYEKMDAWNQSHHKKTGLWEKVVSSEISLSEAEQETLDFIAAHISKNTAPLAGNSIWQDRRFLAKYMSKIDQYLNYRVIDVTSVKELALRWSPQIPEFKKKKAHRALGDIEESIAELKYYRDEFFKISQ